MLSSFNGFANLWWYLCWAKANLCVKGAGTSRNQAIIWVRFSCCSILDRYPTRSLTIGGAYTARQILRRLDRFRAAADEYAVVYVAIFTIEAECKRTIRSHCLQNQAKLAETQLGPSARR